MMRVITRAVAVLVLALCSSPTFAAITVNGEMSDWGVNGGLTGNTISFSGASGVTNSATFLPDPDPVPTSTVNNFLGMGSTLFYQHEDRVGSGGFVGPHYGGQDYDVEFLGALRSGSDLLIGIVSGQRPDNGFNNYSPGDIRLTINGMLFGIEVGGTGGGTGLLTEGGPGSTYKLYSNGHTRGAQDSDGTVYGADPPGTLLPSQTAGSIWKPDNWVDVAFDPGDDTQFQILAGDFVGTSDYAFSRDSVGTHHSFIEAKIDLNLIMAYLGLDNLGDLDVQSVEWSPSCRNDVLFVELETETGPNDVVPEPASILIWSLVSAAAVFSYRRKSQRRS